MSKVEITKPGLFVVVCDEVASAWTFETREDAAAFIADKDESTGGNFGFHLYDLRDFTGSPRSIADVLAQSRESLQQAQTSARDWAASAGRLREHMARFKRERDALKAALNTALAEMVTLKARLSEPYRTNVTKACEVAKAALAEVKS